MSRSRKNSAPNSVHMSRDNSLKRWASGLMSKQGASGKGAESSSYAKEEEQSKWYSAFENEGDKRVRENRREWLAERERERERARELESAMSGSQEEQPDMEHLNFVRLDPMGRLLLQCVRDNMLLKEKVGCSEGADIDLGAFCTAFFNKASVEKKELEDTLKHTAHSIKHDMIESKMRSHDEANGFPAPTYFSPNDTLTTPILLSHNSKLFPFGSGKFSGYKSKDGEGGVGVIEFLSLMNRSQEIAKLSKKEFLNQLLNSTTGRAHSLLTDWISNGEDIKSIYHSLILNFDKRISIEDARARLATYKAQKISSLAKIESDIMSLASRSSTSLPQGPSRMALYNLDATMALIRALPPVSSAMASNTFATLNSELGRAATFTELSRALNVYRHTIDQDIHSQGSSSKDKAVASSGQGAVRKTWGNKKGKATSYGISAGQVDGNVANRGRNPSQPRHNDGNQATIAYGQGGPPKGQRQSQGQVSRNPNQGSGQQGRHQGQGQQGQYQGQGRQGQFQGRQGQYQGQGPPQRDGNGQFRGKSRGSYKGNRGGRPATYCSLCGNTDHVSKDGCPYITDDNGIPVRYDPIQGVCSVCPPGIMPRLNHAEKLCPYRPKGPLYNTTL